MIIKYCKCGCGTRIKIKSHHKYYGIPDFIPKHVNKGVLKTKREKIKCKNCGKIFYDIITKKRKFCSKKCYWKWLDGKSQTKVSEEGRKNLSKGKIGDKNPNWKGGRTLEIQKIRCSLENRLWKYAVFCRDKFTCQECDNSKCYIEAHHIKPFAKILKDNNINTLKESKTCEELWDINNGKTLCKECHEKISKGRGTIKNV